ncbi:hypothetical protein [Emcibacter sp.]|uniref:hypothetical protein n=1 Tax=Emcibacter sp. TaxID=1979954 RepID=UPI002AA74133|nr:hypothetical protein [Emcibacter sp.]
MSGKPLENNRMLYVAGLLLVLGLSACSGNGDAVWPEMKADETWNYMQQERIKPVTPNGIDSEDGGPVTSLPPSADEEQLSVAEAGESFMQLDGRFADLEPEMASFTRELGLSLKETLQSREDEVRRQEYWRGSQMTLSRLADRQARLETLVQEVLSVSSRIEGIRDTELEERFQVLLRKSQALSARTEELIATAEKQLARIKQ